MKESPNILVVDDEEGIQLLLRKALTKQGCHVKTTGSGQDAVTMARNKNYDIIFLDVRLPQVSGYEVLQSIKNTSPDTHLVMMSGKPLESRVKNVLCEESDGFISKPFHLKEIVDLVGKITSKERTGKRAG